MIKIDLISAIAVVLSLTIVVIFMSWVFYRRQDFEKNIQDNFGQLVQCPYCTSAFYVDRENEIKVCPHCKSYLNIPHSH